MRYGTGILQWRVDELKELDRKARKLVKTHRQVHPKCDEDRLSVSRSEGARGLTSCESATRSEKNNLGWYLKNSDESLLQRVKRVRILQFFGFFSIRFSGQQGMGGDHLLFHSTISTRSRTFRYLFCNLLKRDFKKSLNEKRLENWKEKQMYGQFIRDMLEGTDREKSWLWMRKCENAWSERGLFSNIFSLVALCISKGGGN